MNTGAEPGRWRGGGGGGGGRIPEDVVALIVSHLPLKSLGRFKAVSRSWCLLIQSLNLSPFFLGLFYVILSQSPTREWYRDPSSPLSSRKDFFQYIVGGGTKAGIDNYSAAIIDPWLSFLPIPVISVLDCCNGLLLLCERSRDFTVYVCNPLTKSWTQLFGVRESVSLLDFDPKVSPYFKVVNFRQLVPDSLLKIRILSSQTPTMTWKRYAPIRFRDPSDHEHYSMMISYQHHALWKGSLYSLFGRDCINFGDPGRIMRFELLEDHITDPQLIELPKGTKKPRGVAIGRLRNMLCLAGLDWINNNNNNNNNNNGHKKVLRLRVWSLSSTDQTVWVLEHDIIITTSHLLYPGKRLVESTYIAQFHPLLDVVFIISKNMVYACDLATFSVNEVCHIGSKKWEVSEASVFPFLPSLVDYSSQWKTKRKREKLHMLKARGEEHPQCGNNETRRVFQKRRHR